MVKASITPIVVFGILVMLAYFSGVPLTGRNKGIFWKYWKPGTSKKLLTTGVFLLSQTLWNEVGAFWQYEPAWEGRISPDNQYIFPTHFQQVSLSGCH